MTGNETMDDVDHTTPYTAKSFGEDVAFRRGAVAADGGARFSGPRHTSDRARGEDGDTDTDSKQTMRDVSHTAPGGPQRAFERGTEGRTDTV